MTEIHQSHRNTPTMLASNREKLAYNTKALLTKERLTKQEACWLTGIPRGTWDRYRKRKKAGDPAMANFPATETNDGNPRGRCYYKTSDVVNYINTRPEK